MKTTAKQEERLVETQCPEVEDGLPNLGDRYEIIERIGRGGMGSVYKVRDKTIDATLAIKVLQQELVRDTAALKRFEQEAEAAKQLSHPNLVSVYGHGTTCDGAPYIVMDYLQGRGLADILKEAQTLEPKRALKIFMDICEGLSYAHKQGVIHRDIKPTNVIITNEGTDVESAHIVDFGIAKVMPTANRETHDLTQTGEIFGSPHYMSPEQCLGFMLDNRSDLYSLGCLMYEVLTGGAPFEGANPIQVVVKHINEEPADFPKAVKTDKIVDKLEHVVMRCLDKEKTERYQHADDVIKDLESIDSGKQVAKYNRVAKAKPMFTRRQMMGVLVVFVGITIYGAIATAMFSNELGGKILGGVISMVCLAGVYVFYSAAMEIFRKRVKTLTEPNAWRIVLLVALGTGCLTAVQFPCMLIFNHYWFFHDQETWGQFFFATTLVHVISLVTIAISALGCVIFRASRVWNPILMFGKMIVIGTVLALFSVTCIPVQTAKILSLYGQTCREPQPWVAKYVYEKAVQLDPKETQYLDYLSGINHRLGLHEEELKNLTDIVSKEVNNYWRMTSLARTFSEHKQPYNALNYYNKVVELAGNNESNRSQLASALQDRGDFRKGQGELKEARNDYLESLKLSPRNETIMRSLAQIDCALGLWPEAATQLEKVLQLTDNLVIKDRVLLGMVQDQQGLHSEAQNQFRLAVNWYKNFGTSGNSDPALTYAFKQLGLKPPDRLGWYRDRNDLLDSMGILALWNSALTVK